MHWFEGHALWMIAGWFIGIVLFVTFLLLVLRAVTTPPAQSPETTLKRRYAAGEMDTEEYERRLAELHRTKAA